MGAGGVAVSDPLAKAAAGAGHRNRLGCNLATGMRGGNPTDNHRVGTARIAVLVRPTGGWDHEGWP